MFAQSNLIKVVVFPAEKGWISSRDVTILEPDTLTRAEDIVFETSGERKKRGGQARVNSTQLTGATYVRYVRDFWLTSGTQKRIACHNGTVLKEDLDGTWDAITGSVYPAAGEIVSTEVFNDLLIILSSGEITAQKWDGAAATTSNLGGTPPAGKIVKKHQNRIWIAGDTSAKHRLYYSQAFDPEVWSGPGTGSLDIDPGDGDPDGITAIFPSFFGELFVAKRTKLYKISGSSPSGDFAFRIEQVSDSIGCIAHNSVVATQDDVIFCSDRGVHSLKATANFGNVEATFISAPIHDFWHGLKRANLKKLHAVFYPRINSYLLGLTTTSSSENNEIIGFNIVTGGWFRWTGYDCVSMATVLNPVSNDFELWTGGQNGYVNRYLPATLNDFGTAISADFKTPVIYPDRDPDKVWGFKSLSVIFKPKGNYNFTVKYKIDNQTEQTATINQVGTGALLGDNFTLGTSVLGTTDVSQPVELQLEGYGKGIVFNFVQNGINEDIEILGYVLKCKFAGQSQEIF